MVPGAAILALSAVLAATPPVFTVAIDPGHGGSNRGAPTKADDVFEKHVTLAIAKRVQKLLASERDLKVVLCRSGDVFLPIRARVRCGNQAGARLFVSVHANASDATQAPGSQVGFTLFVLPTAEVDKQVTRVALLAADDSEAAWAGHVVRETAKQSLAAARRIEWRLADTLGRNRDRGIKQEGATLDVLQGLEMPAVLVEVGFLDHQDEGPYLLTDEGQQAIAVALAGAITDLRGRERRGLKEPMVTAPRPNQRPSVEGSAQSEAGEK
jgi:N-acetylmuramoyl-L-alanine amidase